MILLWHPCIHLFELILTVFFFWSRFSGVWSSGSGLQRSRMNSQTSFLQHRSVPVWEVKVVATTQKSTALNFTVNVTPSKILEDKLKYWFGRSNSSDQLLSSPMSSLSHQNLIKACETSVEEVQRKPVNFYCPSSIFCLLVFPEASCVNWECCLFLNSSFMNPCRREGRHKRSWCRQMTTHFLL